MNYRVNKIEPLCMTSERGEVIFSESETAQIKAEIGKRIIEAFNYQPISEIAFLLKTNCATINSFIDGEEFPSTEVLLCIHQAIGVSIDWLITGKGAKQASYSEHFTASIESVILEPA